MQGAALDRVGLDTGIFGTGCVEAMAGQALRT
jgi:hypothetical protein